MYCEYIIRGGSEISHLATPSVYLDHRSTRRGSFLAVPLEPLRNYRFKLTLHDATEVIHDLRVFF